MKKSISLTYEEAKQLLASIYTSSNYLELCKSRFLLLDMSLYIRTIDKEIIKLESMRVKLENFCNKFVDSNNIRSTQNEFDTFNRLLDSMNKLEG